MMTSLPGDTWGRLVLWTAIGLVIYFLYGIHHALPSKWNVAKEG
jgi:APA family basic amino acid/polyamine antiporter